jgi:hypothetical protein
MVPRATKITARHSRYSDEYIKHNLGRLGQTLTFPNSRFPEFDKIPAMKVPGSIQK